MSSNEESKVIRVPIFDGKEGNFQTWQVRFRAYKKLSGFIKALEEILEPDLSNSQAEADALMGSNNASKKKIAAAKRNDSAIASLILAFSTDDLIAMIL